MHARQGKATLQDADGMESSANGGNKKYQVRAAADAENKGQGTHSSYNVA